MAHILQFYSNRLAVCGKTFDEWLAASDQEWLECHSFIQWIFPLMYASPNAPGVLLDEQSLNELKSPAMLHQMKLAFERFYDFVGFDSRTKKLRMYYYGRVDISAKRISRALASMQNVGLVEESYLLLESLINSYPHHTSMWHWKDACLGAARAHASNASCMDTLRFRNTIVIDDDVADASRHVDAHNSYVPRLIDVNGSYVPQHLDAHGSYARSHADSAGRSHAGSAGRSHDDDALSRDDGAGGYAHPRAEGGSGSSRHSKKQKHFIDLTDD